MTAAFVSNLFRYNTWADRRILDALANLPEDIVLRDLGSSHGGLHGTMLHVVFAQNVWLLRWKGEPIDAAFQVQKNSPTLASVREAWERTGEETARFFAGKLSDAFLAETFEMRNSKGESFVHAYGDSMIHLVNHSSYHRGQIAGMMRQLGVRPPGTDYIIYTRERKQ